MSVPELLVVKLPAGVRATKECLTLTRDQARLLLSRLGGLLARGKSGRPKGAKDLHPRKRKDEVK